MHPTVPATGVPALRRPLVFACALLAAALPAGARAADGAQVTGQTVTNDQKFAPGSAFTEVWTFKNTGDTTWNATDYDLGFLYTYGDHLGAAAQVAFAAGETIAPNQSKSWSLPLTAPAAAGSYRGAWQMKRYGNGFGDIATLEIIVQPSTPEDKDGDGHASIASGGDDCDDNDPEVYPGHPEICDGKDNDCNGQIDEGLADQPCASPCPGTTSCVNGAWTDCNGPAPQPEVCNGIDDDCNGLIDDGAVCPDGELCALGRCVPPREEPDASAPAGPDAGPLAGPDASRAGTGADGGPGSTFQGGGCGCATAGAGGFAAGLLSLAGLWRRRR